MSERVIHNYEESVTVKASAQDLYDIVSDITRTGGGLSTPHRLLRFAP